jgi:hypothetical protein
LAIVGSPVFDPLHHDCLILIRVNPRWVLHPIFSVSKPALSEVEACLCGKNCGIPYIGSFNQEPP